MKIYEALYDMSYKNDNIDYTAIIMYLLKRCNCKCICFRLMKDQFYGNIAIACFIDYANDVKSAYVNGELMGFPHIGMMLGEQWNDTNNFSLFIHDNTMQYYWPDIRTEFILKKRYENPTKAFSYAICKEMFNVAVDGEINCGLIRCFLDKNETIEQVLVEMDLSGDNGL